MKDYKQLLNNLFEQIKKETNKLTKKKLREKYYQLQFEFELYKNQIRL